MESNTREFDVAYSWLDEHIDSRFWDIPTAQRLEELLINIQKPVQPLPPYSAQASVAEQPTSQAEKWVRSALKMLDEIPQAELRVFKAREHLREALAALTPKEQPE